MSTHFKIMKKKKSVNEVVVNNIKIQTKYIICVIQKKISSQHWPKKRVRVNRTICANIVQNYFHTKKYVPKWILPNGSSNEFTTIAEIKKRNYSKVKFELFG